MSTAIRVPASAEGFDEPGYLAANPDVAAAVGGGAFKTGRDHFDQHGHCENREMGRHSDLIPPFMEAKIERIAPLLRLDLPHVKRGPKYDFISDELRAETAICDTDLVSAHDYDHYAMEVIDQPGLVLDCGCGRRNVYHDNVVNLDIVDYDTTDIIAVGECLPFKDNSFDGVLSLCVLEHVRDPFACAREIIRVLKPGGRLLCVVPFLQPLHGYPHHYYNMTHQGVRALFERDMTIDRQFVPPPMLPIWLLAPVVQIWAAALHGEVKEEFLSLPLRELLKHPAELWDRPWVTQLPEEKNFELAACTMMEARKARAFQPPSSSPRSAP